MPHEKKEVDDGMSDSYASSLSFETKSSLSGRTSSTLTPPKPFGIVMLITLFFLFLASVGGLSTSAVHFQTPSRAARSGVDQSFVMFSSLIAPVYIFLHLFVSFRNYELVKRHGLQSPFVSWTVIVARLSLILWVVTTILASVVVARDSNTVITRSNLAISIFGLLCTAIMVMTIEISNDPFDLPYTPQRVTVNCLVSSFDSDLIKRRSARAARPYRTMTIDSSTSRSSRNSVHSGGSKKRYAPPSPPLSPPDSKRCETIFEEEEVESQSGASAPTTAPSQQQQAQQFQQQQQQQMRQYIQQYHQQQNQKRQSHQTPSPPKGPRPLNTTPTPAKTKKKAEMQEIGDRPPRLPEPCHVPMPGTAWANDWEALTVDAGMDRAGSPGECACSTPGATPAIAPGVAPGVAPGATLGEPGDPRRQSTQMRYNAVNRFRQASAQLGRTPTIVVTPS